MTLERPAKKVTRFTAKDAEGTEYKWAFWYDSGYKAWFLRDCEGYERRMKENWVDSVPQLRMVIENYGMTSHLS